MYTGSLIQRSKFADLKGSAARIKHDNVPKLWRWTQEPCGGIALYYSFKPGSVPDIQAGSHILFFFNSFLHLIHAVYTVSPSSMF